MSHEEQWREFERKVADLFALKGFDPTPDIIYAGRQHDIVLKSNEEHVGSVLVECKYFAPNRGGRVRVPEVEDFAARVIRLRNSGDISSGYLVTSTNFTAEAKGCLSGRVEDKFVFLRTFESLSRHIINFKPYLERLVRQHEQSPMYQRYEPLEISMPLNNLRMPCDQVLLDFVSDQDRSIVTLLGDYGSGKTTSCFHLCYTLACSALRDGYTGRIPCYIPLKYFNYCGTAPSLIVKFLTDDVGVTGISYNAFDAMNRAGLLVIVLDGFDEMARRVTLHVREESFRAIGTLCSPNSKVILAGRPGYFPVADDVVRSLDLMQRRTTFDDIRRSLARRKTASSSLPSNVSVYYMAPLNKDQIRSFLAKRMDHVNPAARAGIVAGVIDKIDSTYNLSDLSQRPILLEMIAETMSDLGGTAIRNASDLYEKYTNTWLDIDIAKGNFRTLISSEDRLFFSMVLAAKLFEGESEGLHFTHLNRLVGEHFGLEEIEDIDHFSSDVRTCTFLKREDVNPDSDEIALYSFVHPSFMEYFCARSIAQSLIHPDTEELFLSPDISLSDIQEQDRNILYFLDNMVESPLSPGFWSEIQQLMEGRTSSLALAEDEEDSWNLMVNELSRGNTTIGELHEAFEHIQRVHTSLVNMVSRLVAGGNNEPWLRALSELLSKGSQATLAGKIPRRPRRRTSYRRKGLRI